MFTDQVELMISAGKGGNGIVAWRREKYIPKGGPFGGNGGKGGSVIIKGDANVFALDGFRNKRFLRAENGKCGGVNNRQGKNGSDLVVKVPLGTLIKDRNSQTILFDISEDGVEVELCKGGKGGKGNSSFKSATNQAPNMCTEGELGESLEVELELKLIADIGLVGLPNAGKSTLMSKLANPKVKIGAYPFTTLTPNLGVLTFGEKRLLIADIPGIIEGAHKDKGLGLSFLRHIERTNLLIYVLDGSGEDPFLDFQTLRNELKSYKEELLQKPFLIALNKSDLGINTFKHDLACEISALTGEGLNELILRLTHLLH